MARSMTIILMIGVPAAVFMLEIVKLLAKIS